jgi:RNA polymerase sigma-70 factor (ECF subfamily)
MALDAGLQHQRQVVDAFLRAARQGDFDALLAILDPNVVQRMDRFAVPSGVAREVHGATSIAKRASRGGARAAQAALINGKVGVVVAPQGRLVMVLDFTIVNGKITQIDVIADPARLAQLEIAILA